MKVAIFGGSFDPVHLDHINIAKTLVYELCLDKLYIIPTFIAPHKKNMEAVSGEHRLNMLKLAFEGEDKICVCDYELTKQGVSYSYQTVEHFYDTLKPEKLYFIVGSDMLENFPTWKNPERILDKASLVLVERRNGENQDDKAIIAIKSLYDKGVTTVKVHGETVSSTKLRVYLKLGLSLDGLTDIKVEDYIKSNGLYKGDKYYEYIAKNIPEKRKYHIAGVILTAISLAKKLGADEKKAELSALLHDVAKYENLANFPGFSLPSETPKDIVHQYLGEYIAKTVLEVSDNEVLTAIKYHTTGRPNMSLLEKIIYVADIIEPSRKFLGVEELREEIKKDFFFGFKVCLEEIVEFLLKTGTEVYPLTLDALNYYKEN